jgi:hypothetical protein
MGIIGQEMTSDKQKIEDQWVNIHCAVRRIERDAALIQEIEADLKKNPEWTTYPTEEQRGKIADLAAYAKTIKVDNYLKDKTKTPKDKVSGNIKS